MRLESGGCRVLAGGLGQRASASASASASAFSAVTRAEEQCPPHEVAVETRREKACAPLLLAPQAGSSGRASLRADGAHVEGSQTGQTLLVGGVRFLRTGARPGRAEQCSADTKAASSLSLKGTQALGGFGRAKQQSVMLPGSLGHPSAVFQVLEDNEATLPPKYRETHVSMEALGATGAISSQKTQMAGALQTLEEPGSSVPFSSNHCSPPHLHALYVAACAWKPPGTPQITGLPTSYAYSSWSRG